MISRHVSVMKTARQQRPAGAGVTIVCIVSTLAMRLETKLLVSDTVTRLCN